MTLSCQDILVCTKVVDQPTLSFLRQCQQPKLPHYTILHIIYNISFVAALGRKPYFDLELLEEVHYFLDLRENSSLSRPHTLYLSLFLLV